METPRESGSLSRRRFVIAAGASVAVAGVGAGSGQAAAVPVVEATDAMPAAGKADGAKAPQGTWLAGDTHVHDDHSSDGSLPRQTSKQTLPGNLPVGDQIAQGERTGLDFMPLTDHRTYDQVWDPSGNRPHCCCSRARRPTVRHTLLCWATSM